MTGPGRELIENVHNGRLEIALAALRAEEIPEDLTFDPVGDPEPPGAVVPADHQRAARKRVRLEELAKKVPLAFTGHRSDGLDPVRPFHVLELTGSALSLTIGVFKRAERHSASAGTFLAMLLAENPRSQPTPD